MVFKCKWRMSHCGILDMHHQPQPQPAAHAACLIHLTDKGLERGGLGKICGISSFFVVENLCVCIKFCLLKICICVCLLPMDEIFWDYLFLLTRNRKKEKILSLYSMVHYLNINSYAYQATTNFFNFYN